MLTETVEHKEEYLIERICLIAREYEFIMGKSLDDRVERFLTTHGFTTSGDRAFSEVLSNVPLKLLNDLSQKMRSILESPEVAARLKNFPPNYSDESFDCGTFEEDECEDF